MTDYEFTGKTVDEAVDEGLKALGLTREEADIQVLDEGKKGGLFTKGVKARVRIGRKKTDGERAVDFLDGMFGKGRNARRPAGTRGCGGEHRTRGV